RPYTQGELVAAMKGIARLVRDPRRRQTPKESTGIGTEATRAAGIQGLLDRGDRLRTGRAVRPSDTARMLLGAVPAAVADPGLTAVWEQALDLIASGQLSLEAFVARQSAWVAQLVEQYRVTTLAVAPSAPQERQRRPASRTRRGKGQG